MVKNICEWTILSKFFVGLASCNDNSDKEQFSSFLTKLFDFLLMHHESENKVIRFCVCYFINMLLNFMGENAFLNDDLCDSISAKMIDRLQDISPKVRAQAVFALHRWQDPLDNNCPIISSFIYHLSKDPNVEVRRAIIVNIGQNKKTLQGVLQRTRDVNDTIRKLAYEFVSKITAKSLTIQQREMLLSHGLRDRSEVVIKFVKNVLSPKWLRRFDGKLAHYLALASLEH